MCPPYFPHFGRAFLLLWVWSVSITRETLRGRKGKRGFAAPQPKAAGEAEVMELRCAGIGHPVLQAQGYCILLATLF